LHAQISLAYVSRGENLLAASTPDIVIKSYLTGKLTLADYTMCNLVTNIMNWTSVYKTYKETAKSITSKLWTNSSMPTT